MKAFALKSTLESVPARKPKGAVAYAGSVPPRFIQTASTQEAPIQRKADCACGGGCPRCQEGNHHESLQAKLNVSNPGDQYEQEADRVAEQVMRMPETSGHLGMNVELRHVVQQSGADGISLDQSGEKRAGRNDTPETRSSPVLSAHHTPALQRLEAELEPTVADPSAEAPQPAPSAPAASAKCSETPRWPKLTAGKVVISDKGTKLKSEQILHQELESVQSHFAVKTESINIVEPPAGQFEYGLVQNVLFEHFEASFAPYVKMVIDAVGPAVDVFFEEPPPFFHEGDTNPDKLWRVGNLAGLSVFFEDKPEFPLDFRRMSSKKEEKEEGKDKGKDEDNEWAQSPLSACGEAIKMTSASDSLVFRVGLVARNVETNAVCQLGAESKMYAVKWTVENLGTTRKLTSNNDLDGTYDLALPGPDLALEPPRGVEIVNQARNEGLADLSSQCKEHADAEKAKEKQRR